LERARIQLCGRLAVIIDGERMERRLPGRQGRLLFAFLVVQRNRSLTRSQLLEALWPEGRDGGLAPLLSKLRRVVPLDETRLLLPAASWVDLEAAAEAVHRAESAIAQRRFHDAWGPSQVAMFVAGRPFFPDEELSWVTEVRHGLDDLRLRAMEAYARAALGIGGTELPAAIRVARLLVESEPYRESGYLLLMEGFAREGNKAEGLRVYEKLRRRLRNELGVSPGEELQELHRQLLH